MSLSLGRSPTVWLFGALALAASAAAVEWKRRRVEQAFPPMGRFIDIDGVRLHYVERGAGDPLLLLHGNGSNLLDLEQSGLLERAAARYRVIAFDRPGFGYSSRPRTAVWTPQAQARLLHRALHRLGVVRPIVVAHSMGTQVALSLAQQYPEAVRSLALLSGYYFPSLRLDTLPMAGPAIPLIGDVMRYTVSPWIGRLLWPLMTRRVFAPKATPPAFRAYPPWMSLRPASLRAGAEETAFAAPVAIALKRHYAELRVPVVVMAGTDDRFVKTEAQSVRLHRELPCSELTLTPGAGHMVHYSALDDVMAAIDAAASAPPVAAAARSAAPEPRGEPQAVMPGA